LKEQLYQLLLDQVFVLIDEQSLLYRFNQPYLSLTNKDLHLSSRRAVQMSNLILIMG
jgi:hypothetical protein